MNDIYRHNSLINMIPLTNHVKYVLNVCCQAMLIIIVVNNQVYPLHQLHQHDPLACPGPSLPCKHRTGVKLA